MLEYKHVLVLISLISDHKQKPRSKVGGGGPLLLVFLLVQIRRRDDRHPGTNDQQRVHSIQKKGFEKFCLRILNQEVLYIVKRGAASSAYSRRHAFARQPSFSRKKIYICMKNRKSSIIHVL